MESTSVSTGWRPRRSSTVGVRMSPSADVTADQFADAGQHLDLEAGVAGQIGQFAEQVGGGAGKRHQQRVGLVLGGGGGHLGAVAHHRHAHDPQVPLGGVVVEERHREIGARRVSQQGRHDLRSGVAGAEDEDAADVRAGGAAVAFVVAPDEVPSRAHEDEGDDASTDDDAERHEPVGLAQIDQEQRRAHPGHGAGQRRDLVEAAEPPPTEVEAGAEAHQHLDDHGGAGEKREARPVDLAGVEVVAQEDGAEQAPGPGQGVGADAPLQEQEREAGGMHRSVPGCHGVLQRPVSLLLPRTSGRLRSAPGSISRPELTCAQPGHRFDLKRVDLFAAC